MKAKTKTKRNIRKLGGFKISPKEEDSPPRSPSKEAEDLSLLTKPIETSITGLRQISKLFDTGSDEIKSLLDYECHIIYECKICQSLYRSLANFLSHKRVYCKAQFNITFDKDAIKHSSMNHYDILEDNQGPADQETKENQKNERVTRSSSTKEVSKKDLAEVVQMLQKKHEENDELNRKPIRIMADTEQVLLEKLDSSTIAYQSVLSPANKPEINDLMRAQATELATILERDTAILGPDGQLIEIDSLENIEKPPPLFPEKTKDKTPTKSSSSAATSPTSAPGSDLTCTICSAKFSTKKTLTFHIKSLHTSNRMVYPCPLCMSSFTNPWGTYRHLFKIHKKTNEQVRKMRNQILEKAHQTDLTLAQDIERVYENEKLNNSLINGDVKVNETEEWMAHLESDSSFQRCGGCGKRFDRKAALLSHSQICQKRIAACSDASVRAKRQKLSPTNTETSSRTSPSPPSQVKSSSINTSNSISVKDIIGTILSPKVPNEKMNNNDDFKSLPDLTNLSSSVTITRLVPEAAGAGNDGPARTEGGGGGGGGEDSWSKVGAAVGGQRRSQKITDVKDELAIISLKKEVKEEVTLNDEKVEIQGDDPEIVYTKIEKSIKAGSVVSGSRKRKMRKTAATNGLSKRCKVVKQEEQDKQVEKQEKQQGKKQLKNVEKKEENLDNKIDKKEGITDEDEEDPPASSRVTAIERRIAQIADEKKLLCVPCDTKFSSMVHLRRHIVIHINWNRYHCKICDFKCFDKGDSVIHCNKYHNAKNDHSIIDDMIEELEPDKDIPGPAECKNDEHAERKEEQHLENGEANAFALSDDEHDSPSDSGKNHKDIMKLARRSNLDENPELRRMVMEVIFGSTESQDEINSSNEQEDKMDSSKLSNGIEDQNNSSDDESEDEKNSSALSDVSEKKINSSAVSEEQEEKINSSAPSEEPEDKKNPPTSFEEQEEKKNSSAPSEEPEDKKNPPTLSEEQDEKKNSSTPSDEKEKKISSKSVDKKNKTSINRSNTSSPSVDNLRLMNNNSPIISNKKNKDSKKSSLVRPARNRSKPINKDFIYDLDSVLSGDKAKNKLLPNNNLANNKSANQKKNNNDNSMDMDYEDENKNGDLNGKLLNDKANEISDVSKNCLTIADK